MNPHQLVTLEIQTNDPNTTLSISIEYCKIEKDIPWLWDMLSIPSSEQQTSFTIYHDFGFSLDKKQWKYVQSLFLKEECEWDCCVGEMEISTLFSLYLLLDYLNQEQQLTYLEQWIEKGLHEWNNEESFKSFDHFLCWLRIAVGMQMDLYWMKPSTLSPVFLLVDPFLKFKERTELLYTIVPIVERDRNLKIECIRSSSRKAHSRMSFILQRHPIIQSISSWDNIILSGLALVDCFYENTPDILDFFIYGNTWEKKKLVLINLLLSFLIPIKEESFYYISKKQHTIILSWGNNIIRIHLSQWKSEKEVIAYQPLSCYGIGYNGKTIMMNQSCWISLKTKEFREMQTLELYHEIPLLIKKGFHIQDIEYPTTKKYWVNKQCKKPHLVTVESIILLVSKIVKWNLSFGVYSTCLKQLDDCFLSLYSTQRIPNGYIFPIERRNQKEVKIQFTLYDVYSPFGFSFNENNPNGCHLLIKLNTKDHLAVIEFLKELHRKMVELSTPYFKSINIKNTDEMEGSLEIGFRKYESNPWNRFLKKKEEIYDFKMNITENTLIIEQETGKNIDRKKVYPSYRYFPRIDIEFHSHLINMNKSLFWCKSATQIIVAKEELPR